MTASGGTPADFPTLLDWVEGRLAPADAARVAQQVASGDDRTHATVEWLRDFVKVAREVEFEDPPPVVRRSLIRHFDAWKRTRLGDAGVHRGDIIAEPCFDSRDDLAATGVRGGHDDEATVHLAFASDAGDLLIDATLTASGRIDLEGQVLTADATESLHFEATVYGATHTTHCFDSDGLGRFSVRDLAAERCRIRADNGHIAIVAELDLGIGDSA